MAEQEKNYNIEESLKRIEEINKLLEKTTLPLNEALKLYQEGALIVQKCNEHFQGVETTLKEIEIDPNELLKS